VKSQKAAIVGEIPPSGRPYNGETVRIHRRLAMKTRGASNRQAMMAMVLGTALTAWSATPASAEESAVRDLSRYCTACWRNAGLPIDRWADCTQEVFCQLLQRLPRAEWTLVLDGGPDEERRREFLRVVDLVKKRVQREKRTDPLDQHAIADPRGNDEWQDVREEIWTVADEILTPRQRQILARCADGYTVADIATELKLPAQRISDEKYKAIQKLGERLQV
jgi:DNA-binding CsgD family transcriptional regulator